MGNIPESYVPGIKVSFCCSTTEGVARVYWEGAYMDLEKRNTWPCRFIRLRRIINASGRYEKVVVRHLGRFVDYHVFVWTHFPLIYRSVERERTVHITQVITFPSCLGTQMALIQHVHCLQDYAILSGRRVRRVGIHVIH